MKTKKLIVMMALFAFSVTALYAQRVEVALVDGLPVINCVGMPAAVITATAKGANETLLKTAAANATVFNRFAVAKTDNSTSSNWSDAFIVCSRIGAGWRLPTQRELMLMVVLKTALEKASGFTSFGINTYNYYWSATEYDRNNGWIVNFTNNSVDNTNNNKTAVHKVRCLKEL